MNAFCRERKRRVCLARCVLWLNSTPASLADSGTRKFFGRPSMCSNVSYRRWAASTAATIMAWTLAVSAQSPPKPRIVIVATGGTIAGAAESTTAAGYKSGAVAVDVLIAAVPQMKKFAAVTGVQVASVGSQDMNDELWIKLAMEVNRLVA